MRTLQLLVYCFLQLLGVAELVPLRLTPQFEQILQPYGLNGLLHCVMRQVLSVMRSNREQLLNLMDVFVKEPTLDWMVCVSEMLQLCTEHLVLIGIYNNPLLSVL